MGHGDPQTLARITLTGTVTDGSGIGSVQIRVTDADGNVFIQTAVVVGNQWSYTPQGYSVGGSYSLMVIAQDVVPRDHPSASWRGLKKMPKENWIPKTVPQMKKPAATTIHPS